jgi:hypothetical protein
MMQTRQRLLGVAAALAFGLALLPVTGSPAAAAEKTVTRESKPVTTGDDVIQGDNGSL